MSDEFVQKTDLKRIKGKLYYIDLDGDICECELYIKAR